MKPETRTDDVVPIYVESDVDAHMSSGTQAWSYDLSLWGVVGQGSNEPEAIADLKRRSTYYLADRRPAFVVCERIVGDEQAFAPDLQAATEQEVQQTIQILSRSRAKTLRHFQALSDEDLVHTDPDRILPDWANWYSIREMFEHILLTESAYYIERLHPTGNDWSEHTLSVLSSDELALALSQSLYRTLGFIAASRRDLVRCNDAEIWTYRKVLRRLAWHERSELGVIDTLVAQTRMSDGG